MTLTELEDQVAKLSTQELAAFREWFLRFDGQRWDQQIERDATGGKLDRLAREAINELRRGQTDPL